MLMCPPERLSILALPPQQAQLYGVQVLHLVIPLPAVRVLRAGMQRHRSRSRERPDEIGPNGRELMYFVVEVMCPTPYQPRFVYHTAERGTRVRDLRPVIARAIEREERYVELGYPGEALWLCSGEVLEQERLEARCEDPMEWGVDMHEEEWPMVDLTMSGREDSQALLFAVIQIPLDAAPQRRRYRIPDTTQGHQRMINYIQAQFHCEDWRLTWTLLEPIAAGRYGFDDVTVVIELPRPFGRRAGMRHPEVKTVSTTAPYYGSEANDGVSRDQPVGGEAYASRCQTGMVEGGIRSKAGPRKIRGLDKSICVSGCVSLDFADRDYDDNDDRLSIPNAQPTAVGRKLVLCSGRSIVLWAREDTSVQQVLLWVCECVPILSGEFDVLWCPPNTRVAQWGYVREVRARCVMMRAGMMARRDIRERLDALEDDLREARFAIQRVQRGVFRLRNAMEDLDGLRDSDNEEPRRGDERSPRRSRSHSRSDRRRRKENRAEIRHPEVEEIQSDHADDDAGQEADDQEEARSQDSSVSRRCNSPIRVAAGPRARVIWPFYNFADRVCVARLHFEYARLSRRGANTFCLTQHGRELLGWNRLGNLVPHVHVYAPAWHETAISYESPLSSMDERPPDFQITMIRAGSPSKLRGALAKKLAAAPEAPPDALGLIQKLWTLEPSEIQSVQGDPEQVLKKISAMVSRHKLAHTAAGWQAHTTTSKDKADPLLQTDPWAAGKDVVQTVVGSCYAEEAHPFERHKLATRFIGPEGTPIPQIPRWATGEKGSRVVMCASHHYQAVVQAQEEGHGWVVILNTLTGTNLSRQEAQSTQLMIEDGDNPKVIQGWVVVRGSGKIDIVHPAAPVKVTPVPYTRVTLKLFQDETNSQVFQDFARKDLLSRFLGASVSALELRNRKDVEDPRGILWHGTCLTSRLQEVMRWSGQWGVQVVIPRDEENSLGLKTIFFATANLHETWKSIDDLEHCGLIGPTKQQQYVARCKEAMLAELRKRLLGERSQFRACWVWLPPASLLAAFLWLFPTSRLSMPCWSHWLGNVSLSVGKVTIESTILLCLEPRASLPTYVS